MNDDKKVSIIVPVYNCEKFLERCIKSVLNQTYRNFELIIVNDGSTDKTAQICDAFSFHKQVKVIHQQNKGLSYSRNLGIKQSNGDLLYFLDSDDYIHPQTLEFLINVFVKTNADIIVSDFMRIHTEKAPTIYNQIPQYSLVNTETALEMIHGKLHEMFRYGTAWGKLYKKSLFNTLEFPVGKLWEDVFLLYKLYAEANKIIEFDMITYFYYQNPNSITHSQVSEKNLDHLDGLRERTVYIKQNYKKLYMFAIKKELDKHIELYSDAHLIKNESLKKKIKKRYRWVFCNNFNKYTVSKKYVAFFINPNKIIKKEDNHT